MSHEPTRAGVVVTVTMNAAVDRTVTVPNFQPGQRHRASESLTLAGGKGVNIARALKRLEIPVVATGLVGGRTGARVVEELTGEGILNDFVRIEDESRTSTAVVDPMAGTYTEINEWGPYVQVHELELLREKLRYLARGAAVIVFAGTLPRGIEPRFYGDAIRDLNRLGVETVLDADGEPLVLGAEAEPSLVSPNQREAEALAGHEFEDDQDFVAALDAIADRGARNVLITTPTGCFALVREDRAVRRLHAVAPRLDPVSPVGSGDVLLAGFLAARYAEQTAEDALRTAVATGAAATLEVGAGRFDQREVARLAAAVTVVELDRVAA